MERLTFQKCSYTPFLVRKKKGKKGRYRQVGGFDDGRQEEQTVYLIVSVFSVKLESIQVEVGDKVIGGDILRR